MTRLTTLILLFSLSLAGQKSFPEHSFQAMDIFFATHSPQIDIEQIAEADIAEFLKARGEYSGEITLVLYHKKSSKALTHYRYHLYKNDIRIFGAEAHVGIDRNQKIRTCRLPVLPPQEGSQAFPERGIAENVRLNIGAEKIIHTEEVWFTDNSDYLKRGLVVRLSGPATIHQEVLVSGNEIISQADLHRYFHGPNDSVVSVKVFGPDPLTTAQVNYGPPYKDNNDMPHPLLDNERLTKSVVVTYDSSGLFRPENDYVKVLDFNPPNIAPITSTSNQMHYTRDEDGFEDMNVMYHITTHKEHLIGLGFPSIPDYTIEVDAHAVNGADQSFFSTATLPGRLYFGEGGVDDAEDADVIIHEYTHSVIYVAAPSTTTSTERGCIEEALGDYFAASYSNSFGLFNEHQVFNWDGHNEFWPGREVESGKDYGQSSFKNGNIYGHTDLFASPLMEINDKLGRNTADELVLEALFNLGPNTTMSEMAGFIILSDSLLNGGINYQVILEAFARRNILPTISLNEVENLKKRIVVFNTLEFAGGGPVMVRAQDVKLTSYRLTSLNGQLVASEKINHPQNQVLEISSPSLQSGVYLLTLTTANGQEVSYKLIRSN